MQAHTALGCTTQPVVRAGPAECSVCWAAVCVRLLWLLSLQCGFYQAVLISKAANPLLRYASTCGCSGVGATPWQHAAPGHTPGVRHGAAHSG